MKRPKFLQPHQIEGAALRVLGTFCRTYQQPLVPEMSVEAILESTLQLKMAFVTMAEVFGSDDILGAISVNERTIYVDESLDPDAFPEKEGRYRYTLAHEIGHWELHRHEVAALAQGSLFTDETFARILCRASQKYEPREWQANQFAAYFLMPTALVRQVWPEVAGTSEPVGVSSGELMNKRWALGDDYLPAHPLARTMAQRFRVSNQAMQIRLEQMGLLQAMGVSSLTL